MASNRYGVTIEHPAADLFIVKADNPPVIPSEDWAVIVGDCVHNIRCALDYAAWELSGSDPNDTETLYPIFTTEAGWKAKGLRRIKRMSPEAQAFIERTQPFTAPDPSRDALTSINVFDNADKHKLLAVVAARPDALSLTWSMPGHPDAPPLDPIVNIPDPVDIVHGVILATVVVPGATPDMVINTEVSPDIAFGENLGYGVRTHVLASLSAFVIGATSIIDAIERKFSEAS